MKSRESNAVKLTLHKILPLMRLTEQSIHELSGLDSGTPECTPSEQSFRAHSMHDEDVIAVKAIKDPARRLDDLTITSASAEFSRATATFWMICELPDVLENPLDQGARCVWALDGDVVSDCLKVGDRRFRPNYLSHLERRFSAWAWVSVRPSETAISPRAMPSRMVIRSCWS